MSQTDKSKALTGINFKGRKFVMQCHVCAFVKKYPDGGELLEHWLVSGRRSIADICRHFNESDIWSKLHPEFDYRKMTTHRDSHLPSMNTVIMESTRKVLEGNISLEQTTIDTLGIIDALILQGMQQVGSGDLKISSIAEYMRVMEMQHKMLGGERINIQVGAAGGGGVLDEEILVMIMEIMQEFVPPHERMKFRKMLDEKVKPKYLELARQRQLEPPTIEVEVTEDVGSAEETGRGSGGKVPSRARPKAKAKKHVGKRKAKAPRGGDEEGVEDPPGT